MTRRICCSNDAPKALITKVEQVARLIRSKGVGVYFISQNPADIPEVILGQLGNRVQHGLRAFTPKDQKDLASAAETYRPNPRFDTATAIREVGTGEAVTSFLEDKGIPGIVERTLVRPPASQLGPVDPALRASIMATSPMAAKYGQTVDRDSAYERLRARAAQSANDAPPQPEAPDDGFNHAKRYGGSVSGRHTTDVHTPHRQFQPQRFARRRLCEKLCAAVGNPNGAGGGSRNFGLNFRETVKFSAQNRHNLRASHWCNNTSGPS